MESSIHSKIFPVRIVTFVSLFLINSNMFCPENWRFFQILSRRSPFELNGQKTDKNTFTELCSIHPFTVGTGLLFQMVKKKELLEVKT